MTTNIINRIVTFVVLCLVQSLVLNHIHIFGFATPLLYTYMVLEFQRNYPKWAILLWCFMLGIVIDTFSNTPGVTSASLLIIGAIQPYFFEMFLQRDSAEDLSPSITTLGISKYIFYATTLVLLHCLVFFTLETFNFFNWLQWLKCVCGSTVITVILVITIESVRKK
ncbi:MAG: rod shape-determining protein MreD [Prevotella sp.]